jgi:hypothetical protein
MCGAGEDDETESLSQREVTIATYKRWEIQARQKSGTQDNEIEFEPFKGCRITFYPREACAGGVEDEEEPQEEDDDDEIEVKKSPRQTNPDKNWDTGPPPADIDAAQDAGTNTYTHTPGDKRLTYFTHTHVTYTHTEEATAVAQVQYSSLLEGLRAVGQVKGWQT